MPHIIVEYSENLREDVNVPEIVTALHEALAAEGIDKKRIKTRAIPYPVACIGEEGLGGKMIHATLLLLEGRDLPTKKQYGDPLYKIMQQSAPIDCAVTLEIRDMAKDTYYM